MRVDAIHEDEPFSKTRAAAVRRELKELARWLELEPLLRLTGRGRVPRRTR